MMLHWEGKEKIKEKLQEKLNHPSEFEFFSVFNNYPIDYVHQSKSEKTNDLGTIENSFFLGDNLECIKFLLQNGYENKFDLIYVDPPFFTENIFTVKKKLRCQLENTSK